MYFQQIILHRQHVSADLGTNYIFFGDRSPGDDQGQPKHVVYVISFAKSTYSIQFFDGINFIHEVFWVQDYKIQNQLFLLYQYQHRTLMSLNLFLCEINYVSSIIEDNIDTCFSFLQTRQTSKILPLKSLSHFQYKIFLYQSEIIFLWKPHVHHFRREILP